MDRNELMQQYNRFVEQIRTEVKDLYWLYNFFFIIESAMIGSLLMGKIGLAYLVITKISGILLSVYWFIIIRKQRLWRIEWVKRIQTLEDKLEYGEELRMWRRGEDKRFWKDYIVGRKGLWRSLFILPICFSALWVILIFFK